MRSLGSGGRVGVWRGRGGGQRGWRPVLSVGSGESAGYDGAGGTSCGMVGEVRRYRCDPWCSLSMLAVLSSFPLKLLLADNSAVAATAAGAAVAAVAVVVAATVAASTVTQATRRFFTVGGCCRRCHQHRCRLRRPHFHRRRRRRGSPTNRLKRRMPPCAVELPRLYSQLCRHTDSTGCQGCGDMACAPTKGLA